MRWALEDEETAEIQRRRLAARGKPIPDHLWPPECLPGLDEWYNAFWDLSTDRQLGMGAGPIPSASIDRYTAGWDGEDAAMFKTCIRAMDRVFLRHGAGEPDAETSDNPARDAFRSANVRK